MPLEICALSVTDYRKYYYFERYLFDEVTVRFEKEKTLTVFDFFCIIIWKANRPKSKVAERLLSESFDDLDRAVSALMNAVATAQDDKARMRVLIADWDFRLPIASAVLTVLYPTVFTAYDVRVCDVLANIAQTLMPYGPSIAHTLRQFAVLSRRNTICGIRIDGYGVCLFASN